MSRQCLALLMPFGQVKASMLQDAEALADGGMYEHIIENFGDVPFYPRRVPTHTVAFLAVLGYEVKSRFPLPLGVNVLPNDGMSALAIAQAIGAEFIRVNVYTGARVTDQGVIQGQAHRLQRYRKLLGSSVSVFADVAVKHSAPLGHRELQDEVEDTVERGRADAIIVSGTATGKETPVEEVKVARAAAGRTPVFVGSGAKLACLSDLLACADGLIVGTAFKKEGLTLNSVDISRVREFMAAVRRGVSSRA